MRNASEEVDKITPHIQAKLLLKLTKKNNENIFLPLGLRFLMFKLAFIELTNIYICVFFCFFIVFTIKNCTNIFEYFNK